MSSETVQGVADEQSGTTGEESSPSATSLKTWQWVTVGALAAGQGLTMTAFSLAEMAGAFVGGFIGFLLLAVLFRFVCIKLGWTGDHRLFAGVSVVAALVAMPAGIMLIPPASIYLIALPVLYLPLRAITFGYHQLGGGGGGDEPAESAT